MQHISIESPEPALSSSRKELPFRSALQARFPLGVCHMPTLTFGQNLLPLRYYERQSGGGSGFSLKRDHSWLDQSWPGT